MKLLFSCLMLISSGVFATPITHTITFNTTISVTCMIGDTLKLFGDSAGDYVASSVSGGTAIISNINPTLVTTPPFYIGYFIVEGSETSVLFSELNQGQREITLIVEAPTGIRETSETACQRIYYNPFEDFLMIPGPKESIVELYTFDGAMMASKAISEGESRVFLTTLPRGIYILKTGNLVRKIIRE